MSLSAVDVVQQYIERGRVSLHITTETIFALCAEQEAGKGYNRNK